MLDLTLKLLHMLSIKDPPATQTVLDDCIQMFLDVSLDIGSVKKRTSYQILNRFSKLVCEDKNELGNISHVVFESDQERVRFVTSLHSISSFIISLMGQTLSDGMDVNIWRKLCTLLQKGSNAAINQSCKDVIILCLRFILTLCNSIQLPRTVSEEVRFHFPIFILLYDFSPCQPCSMHLDHREQVSASLLQIAKIFRYGDAGNVLSRCLDCVYTDIPDVLVRIQEEELFGVAEICLSDQSASTSLKASLLRCILISMTSGKSDHNRLLELWSKAHAAVLFCDQTLLAPFQTDLVQCLRESVQISRIQPNYGCLEVDGFCFEFDATENAIADHDRKLLGKRNRELVKDLNDCDAASKIRCTHYSEVPHIPTANKPKVVIDHLHRRNEMNCAATLELALVDGAITSCEFLIENLRNGKNKFSSVESFHQLQSTVMVLDASSCPSIWKKLVVRQCMQPYWSHNAFFDGICYVLTTLLIFAELRSTALFTCPDG